MVLRNAEENFSVVRRFEKYIQVRVVDSQRETQQQQHDTAVSYKLGKCKAAAWISTASSLDQPAAELLLSSITRINRDIHTEYIAPDINNWISYLFAFESFHDVVVYIHTCALRAGDPFRSQDTGYSDQIDTKRYHCCKTVHIHKTFRINIRCSFCQLVCVGGGSGGQHSLFVCSGGW